eukprot:gene11316-3353_t
MDADEDDNDDAQVQLDELDSLCAVYHDEFEWDRCASQGDHGTHTCTIQVADNFMLRVLIPRDYPSQSPPIYQLDEQWELSSYRDEIKALLDSLFETGDVVIAAWVESLRIFLKTKEREEEKHRDENQASTGPTATPDDDATQQSFGDCQSNRDVSQTLVKENTFTTEEQNYSINTLVPHIDHGEPFTDRKSTFQGHAARVFNTEEVAAVQRTLLSNGKIARATHNIMAYRIRDDKLDVWRQDCDDDGEHGAASRMLHLLQMTDARNVIVVVSRWYGGIHLGPDRFKHINNCTRDVLKQFGYISDASNSIGELN